MRGGKRTGAGRPRGAKDKATVEQGMELSALAREHTKEALDTLVSVARSSESDAARVSAAVAILDRGYGKPPQSTTIKGEDGAVLMVPVLNVISQSPNDRPAPPKAGNGACANAPSGQSSPRPDF